MIDVNAALLKVPKSSNPAGALGRLVSKDAKSPARIAVLRSLSSIQDGQFSTRQAHVLGLSKPAVAWLASRGEVTPVARGVYRFRCSPGDADPAVAAWLRCWPSGVVSHASAAAQHGLRSIPPTPEPEVTVRRGVSRKPAGVKVHSTRDLPNRDCLAVGGVLYTTIARTVCDTADHTKPWRTLAAVDDGAAAGARQGWMHQRATALCNGRDGVRLVRDATAPGAAAVFRSFLERVSDHVYRTAHLPKPEWNVRVYDNAGLIGIVDALWSPWEVISEKEGLRFHTTPAQRRRDAERFNRLLDAGYAARRFTWQDVVERPVYVAETIARPLVAAGADIDPLRIPSRIEIPFLPFSQAG